ncbi:hypothetical protein NUU61_001201 [Penicillium alfredii]|uniref:Uncharacterized protein n=1 Tax=Penicillium alfredii TaxID=1506179 RepID=A0A9W9KRM6_9EURO|nr:uncharacterized protein NUU61_001201 [Penicillium alfredii]KAJ5115442.1 hypothetical protein NUU61_001201 [Penicillium alfredii]
MRSMKSGPLGIIDTRLTMTESTADGLLSPTFASVLEFDGQVQRPPDAQRPDHAIYGARPMKQGFSPDEVREPFRGLGAGKRYPRLELDVAVDQYHTLDGFMEPANPQNTPASNSEQASNHGICQRCEAENLRTESASQKRELSYNWFDGKLEESFAESGDEGEWPKFHKQPLSADSEPFGVPPITAMNNFQQTSNAYSAKDLEDPVSPVRYIRFSPDTSPSRPSPLIQRPLPSVERNRDYISSYRQKKQFEKWKGTQRSHAQRLSPYHSPSKTPQLRVNYLNKRPDIHFSSLSNLPFAKSVQCCIQPQDEPGHDATGATVPEITDVAADGSMPAHRAASQNRIEFIAISLSLYRLRNPEQSSPGARASMFQVRMNSTTFTTDALPDKKRIVCRSPADELLLHISLIIPGIVLQVPLAVLSAVQRIHGSRIGNAALAIANAILSLAVTSIIYVMSLCGLDVSCYWKSSVSHRSKTPTP